MKHLVLLFAGVGLTLFSCKTIDIPMSEGAMVIKIGDVLPAKARVADGSYVCSRAVLLRQPSLMDRIMPPWKLEVITYGNAQYVSPGKAGTKSVAIRINNGKITEIMAVNQGRGETAKTYATATTFFSVEGPVWVPSAADFDKASDFNEAKSMLH